MARRAVPLSPRSTALLAVVTPLTVAAFVWPLWFHPSGLASNSQLAPLVFALILPVVLAVVISHLTGDDLDVKALALLGVMSAVVAVVRPLGAGTAGIETVFFPIVIAGRALGPGFGFVLGTTGLLTSALLTGGVGPWLPYQMLAAALVGLFSGLLPRLRGRAEVALLAGWSLLIAFAYGWLMDLSFWPFMTGMGSTISYDPHASTWTNLHRFALYNVATSMGWNLGRALTTAALVLVLGSPMLRILRRAAVKGRFA
ncbi:ECF transporter S component [Aestuariimicrobium sp. T2.26MG-19.2B]|uniref:ECF transporter S component n=1 Tax=Aestuariimicrobium sp. T2.26MG-19.2B TaxID=3040679 RepID=UPI00406CDAF0